MKQYFKVTNKEEYDDLMRTIERERPEVGWIRGGEKPTAWNPMNLESFNGFPIFIGIDNGKKLYWEEQDEVFESQKINSWQIGQSIPKTALEELISIAKNKDGSITISPELQVKLVVALRGGEK